MRAWLDSLQQNASPSIEECVQVLGHEIEWLQALKDVPQDPEWHAEGDVNIHTGMVLNELYKLLDDEASHILGWQRQALILGALLHDVGKTLRTKEIEINGVLRIACPQHEAVGRSYLAFKLMGLGLSFKVIWTVLGLVGEHHMPKLLVVKNKPQGDYFSLSRRANLELLYWLEVADMRGRICPDLPSQLQHLDEFKMFAEEYAVWDKAYYPNELDALLETESDKAKKYIAAHALDGLLRGHIHIAEEALGKCYEHKEEHSNLVVLCGPSGIGKSSFVEKHYSDFNLISLDEIREEINGCRTVQKNKGQVIHRAKDLLKESLRSKQDVVWDATNLRSDFRKIICDLGRDYHALVTLVVFLAPEKTIFSGNSNREYSIPNEVLLNQLDSYQFPLVDEAHYYVIVGLNSEILWQSKLVERNSKTSQELHYDF